MQDKEQTGKANESTRRTFMRDGTIVTAGVAAGLTGCSQSTKVNKSDMTQTVNYNPDMEYRRAGKTNLWISSVCLGGHWKRVDKVVPGVFETKAWLSAKLDLKGFEKNRYDVVSKCMDVGINYIDACTWQECVTYAKALKGRRDKMYMGFSWYQEEMRKTDFRTCKALVGTLDKGMKEAGLDYVDVWRVTMLSKSGQHTEGEVEEMMKALELAKKQGKVRFTGLSSHDRPHIKWMIETYPETVQVVCTPYTASTKELPVDSVFEAIRKHDVAFFGIKPFAGTSLFKGDSSPESETRVEDDRLARLAIRYILNNPAITAPIPGMINAHQVENVARAVKERRKLDVAEARELEVAMDRAWANLPASYEWLKDWKYA
ncbi:MAG: aldo/keto reductase [Planctomycetes bacterium]|nr:aldo/keto reductase [Planctomycetota bacterium]